MTRKTLAVCGIVPLLAAGVWAAVALAAATPTVNTYTYTVPGYTVAPQTYVQTVTVPTVTQTVTAPTTTAAAPATYAQATSYTQTPPAFTPTRTVTVSDAASFKSALTNLQAGDLVKAAAPFTVTGETVISKRLAGHAELDLTGVSFVYAGGANLPAVWLNNSSNLYIYGGDLSTSDTGGSCLLDYGSQTVLWWGFTVHDCGGSGVAVYTTGAAVDHLDLEGDVTKVGQNLAWDPHADKGTGVHGAILWDSGSTYAFTNSRFAFNVYSTTVGACVEIGNSAAAPATGDTLLADCNGNPCRATTQTCGNGLELWGDTSTLGLDVKYLEVDNYAGDAVETALASGQNLSGVTVDYGRATNDQTNPYPTAAPLWDNGNGIVYQDVQPAP